MNLLCPTCQKMLQVPEQYAGQMMKCPLCSATFTVPALPQTPAAPPPSPPPGPPPPVQQKAAPGPGAAPPPPSPSEPPEGYTHTRACTVNPRLMPWLAPVSLVLIFVALFFNWFGMFPGGTPAVTQTGFGVAFGSETVDPIFGKYYKDDAEAVKDPGVSVLAVFFILVLIPTLLISLGSTLVAKKVIPMEVPAGLAPFWAFRGLFIGALALAAFFFLVLQIFMGFSLEYKAATAAKAAATRAVPNPQTPEDNTHIDMEQGRELGKYNLRTTWWFTLTVLLNVLAIFGAMMDFWLERRGPQPPPRFELQT